MRGTKIKYILSGFLLVSIFVIFPEGVKAEKKKFTVEKLFFESRSPRGKSSSSGSVSNISGLADKKKWGSLTVLYSSNLEWADNVTVKYYVLLKDEKKKKDVLFSDEVVYMNIPKGKAHRSYVYIHPYAFKRYGNIVKFRAEIWHEGVIVDSGMWPKDSEDKKNWWQQVKPLSGNLLASFFTPFSNFSIGEGQIKFK